MQSESAKFAAAAVSSLQSGTQPAKIGTPLTPGATRVMLLGVETIAVDRYANAPGHQVAHRSHVIDMTNGVAL